MSFLDRFLRRTRPPAPALTFEDLWSQLVPKSGQADTVQGELIRAVGRMEDEFFRNGYGNWDQGYEILSAFALAQLSDGTFGTKITEGIKGDVAAIQRHGRGEGEGSDLEAAHERLCEAAVAWCHKHPAALPREPNPELKR